MIFNEMLGSIRFKVLCEINGGKGDTTISSTFESFPPSTRPLFHRFEQIIKDYEYISQFVHLSRNRGHFISGEERTGLYLSAFFCGVSTILDEFSNVLCQIEEHCLMNSGFSIIFVVNKLEEVSTPLSSIKLAVQQISEKKYSGCSILNLCERFIISGCPVEQIVFKKIQYFCLKPFYLQIKLWITEAKLNDPCNEFFIKTTGQINTDKKSQASFTLSGDGDAQSCLPNSTLASASSSSSGDLRHGGYILDPDNLPSLLPSSVAIKVLFIGESIMMCRQGHSVMETESSQQILRNCGIAEEEVLGQFAEIQAEERFSLMKLRQLIDKVWLGLNRYLRSAADQLGHLEEQLFLMWEMYLLGRGELFQEFLTQGGGLWTGDVTRLDAALLNAALRDSVYAVYLTESSQLTEQFSLILLPRRALKENHPAFWSAIRLRVKLVWPLTHLFTPEILRSYNQLFSFLLRLKNAQIHISKTWKTTSKIKFQPLRKELIETRIHLSAIVGNLHNYCFTNVIANEMNVLMESVKKTDMFTDLQKVLSIFLSNIINRLFITTIDLKETFDTCTTVGSNSDLGSSVSRKVYRYFIIIFELCENFNQLTEKTEALEELKSLKSTFQNTLKKLISILQKIDENYHQNERDSSVHLYNLMMCLDYNGFFRKQLCCEQSVEKGCQH